MAELVRAENELSDWFPDQSANMERSRKDLTKSCFGNILEERTILNEVGTLFLLSCL